MSEVPEGKKAITHKSYMASSWWTKKSKTLLSNPDVVCAICSAPRWGVWARGSVKKKKKAGAPKLLKRFGCHHISYKNLSTDKEDQDIILCCYRCHDVLHTIHTLSKKYPVWKVIYDLACRTTAWEYYEETEYLVPLDFKEKQPRVKKVKKK